MGRYQYPTPWSPLIQQNSGQQSRWCIQATPYPSGLSCPSPASPRASARAARASWLAGSASRNRQIPSRSLVISGPHVHAERRERFEHLGLDVPGLVGPGPLGTSGRHLELPSPPIVLVPLERDPVQVPVNQELVRTPFLPGLQFHRPEVGLPHAVQPQVLPVRGGRLQECVS